MERSRNRAGENREEEGEARQNNEGKIERVRREDGANGDKEKESKPAPPK
ncbi:MAG: hypothetical protein IPI63_00830 [Methanothrix sp.]|jgi:hypothetical protein|nr:hypothetical protein [Methanothrix sp.]MBK7385330.1 hypothetical protein [Methanothrix sp.]HPW74116.1 hypothetical protein [Methanothrix sp.]